MLVKELILLKKLDMTSSKPGRDMLRWRIYDVIESSTPDTKVSWLYNKLMFILILVSIIPLFFKGSNSIFLVIEKITVAAFTLDYILRWITYGLKSQKSTFTALLQYPFTFFAIIDLFSILPSFIEISVSFKLLRLLRLSRAFRTLKLLRYSKNFETMIAVIKKERRPLLAVCILASTYVLVSALVMFSVEPDTFNSFFDAFYWAVVTLTTVGYGDVYPQSDLGRIVSMISSIIGIAIVALPTGIITAGYMGEISKDNNN
ncbi:MAG: ion transporter [Anaerotignum propionicum]|nr:ion transporter [Anaerotignum propionicum]